MNKNQQPDRAYHQVLPRLRAFEVTFRSATNHRPDRVRIKDTNTGQIKLLTFCYTTGSIIDQACDYLQNECGIAIDHIVPTTQVDLLTTSNRYTQLK